MNNEQQTNKDNTENRFTGQNQNGGQNGTTNTGTYNYSTQSKPNYVKKRSTAAMIVGIVLILMGTSYVVDKFLPWVFDWLDSGLVIAGIAIIAGFTLLLRK